MKALNNTDISEKCSHNNQNLTIYDVARFYIQQISKVNRQKEIFRIFKQ